jgi:preprotein translocase subunit SecB
MEVNTVEAISDLKQIRFQVLKTRFELNEAFEQANDKIYIRPRFSRHIKKISKDKFKMILSVFISQENQNNPIPFFSEVTIASTFEFANWEDKERVSIATDNTTAILFPYLRNILSSTTLNANVPPYVLPITNTSRLFHAIESKRI